MLRRTITFRQIFITIAILLLANICVTVFTASTTVNNSNKLYDDEMLENMKDYQLMTLDNGDVVVYQGVRVVGVIKFHEHCDLQRIIMADND